MENKDTHWRERVVWMAQNFIDYIDKNTVDIIYCEDVPPITENSQTIKVLSALQGSIITICALRGIEIKFIPVTTWKSIIGIDLSHSKEYKSWVNLHKSEELYLFKKYVKHYEKALSVENANLHIRRLEKQLKWVSFESKYNQDDIADSINIVLSQFNDDKYRYKQEEFAPIIERLYLMSKANVEKKRRGFKSK